MHNYDWWLSWFNWLIHTNGNWIQGSEVATLVKHSLHFISNYMYSTHIVMNWYIKRQDEIAITTSAYIAKLFTSISRFWFNLTFFFWLDYKKQWLTKQFINVYESLEWNFSNIHPPEQPWAWYLVYILYDEGF